MGSKVVEIYREFLNKDPKRTYRLRIPADTACPKEFAELGKLGTLYSFGVEYAFTEYPRAQLLASSSGKLYIYSPAGLLQPLRQVDAITYFADKGDGRACYVHRFENPMPALVLLGKTGVLGRLQGGGYHIDRRGIVC